MGDVVELSCRTRLPIPSEKVLKWAAEAGLTDVLVVGYDADGDFYFGCSNPDGPANMWLLKLA